MGESPIMRRERSPRKRRNERWGLSANGNKGKGTRDNRGGSGVGRHRGIRHFSDDVLQQFEHPHAEWRKRRFWILGGAGPGRRYRQRFQTRRRLHRANSFTFVTQGQSRIP